MIARNALRMTEFAPPPAPDPARLSVFWFGTQVLWGAILAISLQARASALDPVHAVRDYAIVAGAGAIVAGIMGVVLGPIADRHRRRVGDRRAFYLVGMAASIPALFWFYRCTTYGELIASFIVLEIVLNIAVAPYAAIIPDYVEPGKAGTASSWMSAYQFIGNLIGLVLAGFVTNLTLLAGVLTAFLAISFVIMYVHVSRLQSRIVESRPFTVSGAALSLLISRGFINLGSFTMLGFLYFYVRDSLKAQNVKMETAIMFVIFTLCCVIGAVAAARPTNHNDKRIVVAVSGGVISIGLVMFALARAAPLAYAAGVVAGLAWGAFATADWALAVTIFPEEVMASSLGIWNLASAIPQVIAPLISAPLVLYGNAHVMGLGPRLAFGLVIVEFAIGTALVWRIPGALTSPSRSTS